MSKTGVVIAIIVLVSSNLFFIDLSNGDIFENGDRLPVQVLDNDELLSQEIGTSDPEARSTSRGARFVEQNDHGGSWLDSFEDSSGIDWGMSDHLNLSGEHIRIFTPPKPQVISNTIALWHCDEGTGTSVNDETTNNNDGALGGDGIGTDLPAWVDGKFGKGLSFDGIDDFFDLNAASINSLLANQITLEAFVYPRDLTSYQEIGGGQDSSQPRYAASFNIESSDDFGYDLEASSGQIRLSHDRHDIDNWYYLVGTYDGNVGNFYIDGIKMDSDSNTSGNIVDFDKIMFGADITLQRFFDGILDEIRISDIIRVPSKSVANITSLPISIQPNNSWGTLLIDNTKPVGTNIEITILNNSDFQQIPGSPSYVSEGEFDISYIDSKKYPSIILRAKLEGNNWGLTPKLNYWGVSWNASNAWRDTFFGGVKVDSSSKIESIDGDAQLEYTRIDSTAVASLHFNESSGSTAYDGTANNNHGTITGASWTAGRFNGALDFDGFDDNVKVLDSQSLYLPGGFSISFWMKDSGSSSWTAFITKRTTSVSGLEWIFSGNANSPQTRIVIYDDSQSSWIGREDTSIDIFDGNWHHVVGTWDGGTTSAGIKIYIDGVNVDDTNVQSGTFLGMEDKSIDVLIADTLEAGVNNLNGIIDEVGIYDRPLTMQEITDLNQNNGNFYVHRGNVISKPILIPYNYYWDTLQISNEEVTNTFINVTILDAGTNNVIPGFMNVTGSTIDISPLDPQIYSSIRLQATFGSEGENTSVLHDWSVNWTKNNTAPNFLSLSPNNTELYRTGTTSLEINAFDNETPENSLTIDVEQKHEDSSTWQSVSLSDLRYSTDSWFIDFTPLSTAELGMYDFRVTCTDIFDEFLMMIFEDVIDVNNNLPGPPMVEIKPATPKTTDDLTVTASNSIDIENEPVTYSYQWFKNDVLQENITATLVTASYTTRGDIWRCVVTPNDGNPGGNGAMNSTSVVILNTPPVVSKYIESVELNEDEIDNSSIDLSIIFADADNDLLTYKFTGYDKIDVAVGSSGSNVILTPTKNWFGTEHITITANDTGSEANTTIKIDVKSQNDPPRLLKAGDEDVKSRDETVEFSVYEDNTLDLTFITEDIDGDTVTITSNRTDNVDIRDNVAKMTLNNGLLEFKPDNSHVGSIPIDVYLSDDNGSNVIYKLLINVVNTNDPPTASITYPTNGMLFTEGEQIHFTCDFSDPDLLVPDSIEIIYFKWSTNMKFDPLGEGENLDNLTGVELEPGTHLITLTVRDDSGSQVTDTITITIDKKEDSSITSPMDSSSGSVWILLIVIIVVIIAVIIVFFRRKRIKAEVEYIPPGEEPEAGTFVAKPGAIVPPTVTMEEVPGAAQPEQLPPAAGPSVQMAFPDGIQPTEGQQPAPVPSQPYDMPQPQLPPLGGVIEIEAQPVEEAEAEAETLPDFGVEGGPQPVHKTAFDHDASETKAEEPPDTEAATADLQGAGEVKATEETTVIHEGDKGVWKPDERGKAAVRKEELKQTGTVLEQIEKLGELKEKGLITEDEFQLKKAELLK